MLQADVRAELLVLVWENQHEILLETSREWFSKGSIDGAREGAFMVNAEGNLSPQ
jgi:hypothetical protein